MAECPPAQGGTGPEAEEFKGNQKSLSEKRAKRKKMWKKHSQHEFGQSATIPRLSSSFFACNSRSGSDQYTAYDQVLLRTQLELPQGVLAVVLIRRLPSDEDGCVGVT